MNVRMPHFVQLTKQHLADFIFAGCCVLVAWVSVHDAMLVILHRSVIYQFEQNPMGRWLIEFQGGHVFVFVLAKFAGTAVACTALIMLYECRARLALLAGAGMAMCQIVLLWYLTHGGP